MASKKKTVSAVVAVALAAAILLGGTFAWQSISQEALNEVYGFVNPGGRLHDDFHEITYDENGDVAEDPATGKAYETRHFDKNVYVENFTTILEDGVQIFARVRLDEYMEIGAGAGTTGEGNKSKSIDPTNPNATYENMKEWRTRLPSDTDNPFQKYWDWTMAGERADGKLGESEAEPVFYMPTFNRNKDSLEADVNGTFDGPNGLPDKEDAFKDYDPCVEGEYEKGTTVYDADTDDIDELVPPIGKSIEDAINNGDIRIVEDDDHHAKTTEKSKVITMEQWLNLPDDEKVGNYWVWDIDGWAYWASPIDPDTATGIFLDGIARTKTIINEEWYYGINVVAQFITVEDIGAENGTGFYADGETVSSNALRLLSKMGVKVNTEVRDASTLDAALALGGDVTLATGTSIDVTDRAVKATDSDPKTSNVFWDKGGSISGGALVTGGDANWGIFVNAEKDWPKAGDGYAAAVISDMTITSSGNNAAVLAQAIDAPITLNNVVITADKIGFFADVSEQVLTLNNCVIKSNNRSDKAWQNAAVYVGYNADVVINGGIYTGNYAVAFASTGDTNTITINDGKFYGDFLVNGYGTLTIKGGTFDHDPTAYVDDGYKAVKDETTGIWTVTTA